MSTSKTEKKVAAILEQEFEKEKICSFVSYLYEANQEFCKKDWGGCNLACRKAVEAVLKAIALRGGIAIEDDKFKDRDKGITQLVREVRNNKKIPSKIISSQIPVTCECISEITSNRGGIHDSRTQSTPPLSFYAEKSVSLCKLILVDLLCYCGENFDDAQSITNNLMKERISDIEPNFYRQREHISYIRKRYRHSPMKCAVLILYARKKERLKTISKDLLEENLKRNSCVTNGFRWDILEDQYAYHSDGNYEISEDGIENAKSLLNSEK